MHSHTPYHSDCPHDAACRFDRNALSMWPGLDRRALARCRHDLARIVRLVSRCTNLPDETIRTLLARPRVARHEAELWFG